MKHIQIINCITYCIWDENETNEQKYTKIHKKLEKLKGNVVLCASVLVCVRECVDVQVC